MLTRTLAAAMLAAIGAADLHGQAPLPEPGTRVRATVRVTGTDRLQGTIVSVGGDTLRMRALAGGTIRAIPWASVARLDVWRGQRSHLLAGAGIGLLVGAGAGLAITYASCTPDVDCFSAGITLFGATAAGGLSGGLVGALLWKTDRWEEVPLDRLRVTVVPQRDGRLGLGLAVAF